MVNKWIIIRIENLFYKNDEWNNLYLSDHRKVLNSMIDSEYKISLISSMDINKLIEIKNNLFLNKDCYLIAYNGAQIYNCSTEKYLSNRVFSDQEIRTIEGVLERIVFEEVNKLSIKISKSNGEINLLKMDSISYIKDKKELDTKKIEYSEIDKFEPNKNISCISISLDNKNDITHIFNLLKKYGSVFNSSFVDSNTINIYPLNSTISYAIDTIKKKDKQYNMKIEDIVSIGYTYSDIELFKVTGYNICNEESPDALKKLSEFTYVGDLSKLICVSLKEKFLK